MIIGLIVSDLINITKVHLLVSIFHGMGMH